MARKKKNALSGPMNRLDEIIQKAGLHLNSGDNATADTASGMSEKTESRVETPPPEPSDDEVFSEAIYGVERISWKNKSHPMSEPVAVPDVDPEAEELRLMQEALKGSTSIPVVDHPEYIEGWVGIAGKRFLPDLRNGLYSIQGQIDLHGMNREEAHTAVEEYIIRMARFRSCCIKIICGRGINSPIDRATLKDSLPRLLSTRKMSRYVVAYASAPVRDGGVGSIYVLLGHRLH